MTISMYQASIPAFIQTLTGLTNVLDKAETFCIAKKVDPTVLANARLAPDMFALARQVQIACDFEDNEKTIADLKARIAKTVDFIKGLKPAQIDGSEERDIVLKIAGNPTTFKGQFYLVNFAIPNYYFHLTSAYAILRHNGVELSKGDFLGLTLGR
jgi:uncharacterized protein